MRNEKTASDVYAPGERVIKYYADRATPGGLQITEATDICSDASGYPGCPGVFAKEQLEGWRKVTDAVHAKGGVIVCQLWHTGRASSTAMRSGKQTVSSSSLPMNGSYLDGTLCADDPPRPLTVEEIHALTAAWVAAATSAVNEAGFDGVEIHGANGYLLDQFMHDNVNQRTDAYGGSVENRSRFILDVLAGVCEAVGPEKVGIRLSPYNYFQDTRDSDPNTHWAYLCERIANLPASQRPAYVHMYVCPLNSAAIIQKKIQILTNECALIGLNRVSMKCLMSSKRWLLWLNILQATKKRLFPQRRTHCRLSVASCKTPVSSFSPQVDLTATMPCQRWRPMQLTCLVLGAISSLIQTLWKGSRTGGI